jgi:hypothetical protein
MNRFARLLQPADDSSIAAEQAAATRAFSEAVRASGFVAASLDTALSRDRCLRIGVAPYSLADLRLLDILEAAMRRLDDPPVPIEVFSVVDCHEPADFERLIPGMGTVWQTPVAGWWDEGVLRDKAQGKAARDLILSVCSLRADVLEKLWEPVTAGR